MDAELLKGMLLRLDWIHRAALLLVSHGERVSKVEDEPSLRRDVAAKWGLGRACFIHGHALSSK
jgi:hypothetical protein